MANNQNGYSKMTPIGGTFGQRFPRDRMGYVAFHNGAGPDQTPAAITRDD
jgi:hypothetical protein